MKIERSSRHPTSCIFTKIKVEVSKVNSKEAKKASLAPAQQIVIRGVKGLERHLKKQLVGRPFIKGKRLRIDLPLRVGLLNNSLELVVSSTKLEGPIVVTESTRINWKEEPQSIEISKKLYNIISEVDKKLKTYN